MSQSQVKEIAAFIRGIHHPEIPRKEFERVAEMVEAVFLPWTCCRCKETFSSAKERGAGMVEGPLCMHCTRIIGHYIEHPENNPFPNSKMVLPDEEETA